MGKTPRLNEMNKLQWKPSTMLNPVPVVMVACAEGKGAPNIITVAWTGTVASDPPMLSISIRRERHSHGLITRSGHFTVNLVTRRLLRAADFCGVKSGRDTDKFGELGLTPLPASLVGAPLIAESPVNIECEVSAVHPLGSHDLFLARIVAVNVDERLVDAKGRLRLDRAGLVCYSHGEYFGLSGHPLGYFGYSVRRRKKLKRNR